MLAVQVHSRRAEAFDVVSIDLRPVGATVLPPFSPGAHIDVHVPAARGNSVALVRQYSLCNDSGETHRYVIGVGRDAASRGGSASLHDDLPVGARLSIGAPRNNFALTEEASHSVLVAGGIGITPMLSMARRLSRLGTSWTLYYCTRTPSRAAFLEELLSLPAGGKVIPVFDGMPGAQRLDLASVVQDAPAGAHFYCCGPASMLKAFTDATQDLDDSRVHVEWFSAPAAPAVAADAGTFAVHLKRSGRTLAIPQDKTILEVLLQEGLAVDHSCREGLCGTCETRVLSGTPHHLDPMLATAKSPPSDRMLVCVSRSATPEIVLDL